MRIGHGYDAHRFASGRRLILGGVHIEFDRGMEAHSDGDVVLHALIDALLGAVALGDIGGLFPDTDPAFKDADSRQLLREAYGRVRGVGWQVANVDISVVAQVPKLKPHILAMRTHIASDLDVALDVVNVKATTTERMGFVGREEGIEAHAVALLRGVD